MRQDDDEPGELRDEHAARRDAKRQKRAWGGVHGRAYIRSISDAIVNRAKEAEDGTDRVR